MDNINDEFYASEGFQSFFEKSANSLIIKANSPHFTILAVSSKYLALVHKQRSELLGKNLFEVFPGSGADPSEKFSVFSSFNRVIDRKAEDELPVFKYEIFVPSSRKLETQFWSNLNEPILDNEGNVQFIINTTNNITAQVLETAEKERAQNLLKASEQNMQNMVRQAPFGMCILKGEPAFAEEINDYFLTLVGKTRDQFKAKPYWEVVAEAAAIYEPITKEVFKTGKTYHAKEHEFELFRNGRKESVYLNFVYEPMKDADGQVFALMIVALDVSDQVLARNELQSAYEQVRLSKQAAALGTFDMDVASGIVEWDKRCRELFGISHQEPINYEQDFIGGLHEEDRERIGKIISELLNKATSTGDYDVEYRTIGAEDKKLRWVRAKGKVFFNEKDEPVRFIGSVLEITSQKEDEQRKNDFIGMVSHELKTPLTSLGAYVQMLHGKARKNGDSFTASALDKAERQVKKMGTMINGFLNISRLESGKIHLEKQFFNLEGLLSEAIKETLITNPERSIHFVPCNPAFVQADRDKIYSVVSNLLSNATKYSPPGKEIEVFCELIGNFAQVSVTDQGIGIKASDTERLFERYYRVETKNTKHISGFGIGLYLSAEIIERHQGKIWVKSEPEKGSTFFFSLPVS